MHLPSKKLLLGAAISFAAFQAHAVPFMPTDARAMGMGGTGVSSAEVASTVQFNPALLSLTREDDHFGLKIPQLSVVVADDDGFIDEVEDFDEESEFETTSQERTNIDLLDDLLTAPGGVNDQIDALNQAITDLDAAVDANDINDFNAAKADLNTAIGNLDGKLFVDPNGANAGTDAELNLYSGAVANDLDDLNNKALRMNLGGNIALAIPSKKFSLALSAGGTGTVSGRVLVKQNDTDIFRNYPDAASGYFVEINDLNTAVQAIDDVTDFADPAKTNAFEQAQTDLNTYTDENGIFVNGEFVADDPELESEIEVVGVAIADLGLTASRVFNIKGHDIAFGVTPKLQKVTVFDYAQTLDSEEDFDSDTITDNTEEYTEVNVDLGAAYQFGAEKQFQAGLVIKNLLGKDFESPRYTESNGAEGTIVEVSPQVRAGISHKTSWTKVAFDLDLMENDPVAFEDPTQYAAIGAELNVWRTLQLRAGYRANLAGSDQDVVTAGLGISPLAIHLDIGLMANASDPEKEAGIAFEFGVEF